MAETKTTTLAQIKMGTEKLTRTKTKDNTDIAAYKLPDFEKGSLILAKDTGNIYIDAPDETSRIHVGVGIATVNRGETFNNHYKFNLALSDSTHAEGYKTQAGYNYFEVKAIDVANKKITLGDATGLTIGMSYELFDFNTLVDMTRKITTGTISAISDKVITVDNLPENTDNDKLAKLRFTIPVDWGIVTGSKPALQHVFGNLQTGAGDQSHSEGIWNRALGFTTHVSGGYNTAYDSYSAIIGGTYGKAYGRRDLITGNYNTAYGNNTFICGTRNTAKASSAFVGGYYNIADYHYQSVLGLCNDNKESTLFEIGNGTYETKTDADGKAYIDITSRKNAFEVYLDGHAELQNQGTTDNSVVIRKYLNDTIASQVSSVYKAKGSIANISALAAPSKAYDGFVYNIETEFTTTDNFVEGKGKKFPAGTNIVCINTTGATYKWDVLAGIVDLSNYQAKLVSGTNIKSIKDDKTAAQSLLGSGSLSFKTINNQSLLGAGNITIEGGGGTTITVDDDLSSESTNPVQNKVINAALDNKQPLITSTSDITLHKLYTTNVFANVLSASDGQLYLSDTMLQQLSENSLLFSRKTDGSRIGVILRGVEAGTTKDSAVNLNQLNTKQDKLTSTTDLTVRSVNASNVLTKLLQSGTDALQIVGSEVKLASNNKAAIKITNLANGTATNDAINKGQLDAAVANKQDTFSTVTTTTESTTLTANKPINITTNKYSMVYDDTNEAIKITFA